MYLFIEPRLFGYLRFIFSSNHTPFKNKDLYLQETISTILTLQGSLLVVIHEDILHHLQDNNSTVVHILPSLLMYLRNKVLQSSLLMSVRSKFLRSSLLAFLQYGFLLSSLWNIFLRCLYVDVSTIIRPFLQSSLRRYL